LIASLHHAGQAPKDDESDPGWSTGSGRGRQQASTLRVAVVLASDRQPAWFVEALARLSTLAAVHVACVLDGGHGAGGRRAGAPVPRIVDWYARMDHRLFAPAPWPLDEVPVTGVGGVPMRRLASAEECARELAGAGLDAIATDRDELARLLAPHARAGAWWMRLGDGIPPVLPPGVRELGERRRTLSVTLLAATAPAIGGGVATRRLAATESRVDRLSAARSVADACWTATSLLVDAAARLLSRGDAASLLSDGRPLADDAASVPQNAWPAGSLGIVAGIGLHVGRWAYLKAREALAPPQWCVLYRLDGVDAPRLSGAPPGFHLLRPPPDRIWADPHVVHEGGVHHVFIEDMPYATNRGEIALFRIGPRGADGPVTVLAEPWHLAYPFVFRHRGQYWMIPAADTDGVDVYQADPFPHRWRRHRRLLPFNAQDCTLLEHAGRWYIFAAIKRHRGASETFELHAFHADDPVTGTFVPHAGNPLCSDVRSARPAGPFQRCGDTWVRPAQVCAPHYGYALAFQRIDRLSPTDYAETCIGHMLPDWGPAAFGVHTFGRAAGMTVIDAQLWRPWRGDRHG
jgi:hypothetical protein